MVPLARFRRHRSLTCLLLAWALFWAALWPALGQVLLAQPERAGWVQVCSGSGMVWVALEPRQTASGAQPALVSSAAPWAAAEPLVPPPADGASTVCDWCLQPPLGLGLLLPPPGLGWAGASSAAWGVCAQETQPHAPGWAPQQARAPPASPASARA